jgi:putative glutamine amidotransferase
MPRTRYDPLVATVTRSSPLIALTQADPQLSAHPDIEHDKFALYHAATRRWGGDPVGLDERSADEDRRDLFARMDGLFLTGGADIDPARYGQPVNGAESAQPGRDRLEEEAFRVAARRGVPVLGVCRGLQAINVFSGGQLVQHVDGHAGAAYGHGDPVRHTIEVVPGTRLAGLLGAAAAEPLLVNSYHHQAVVADGLAAGLVASAWTTDDIPPLIEGLESMDDRFLFAIQCHPERTDSTPPVLERLFEALVDAARERMRVPAA